MTYNWFKIFSLPEFLATELVSRTYKVSMEGVGQKDILVLRGNEVSVVYDDTLLPIQFSDDNPFVRVSGTNTYAVYKDISDNVWLGIGIPSA